MKKSDPESIETQYYEALFEAERLRQELQALRRQLAGERMNYRHACQLAAQAESEVAALRRQLADARARLAQRDAASAADAEDYPPERLARMEAYIQHEPPTE